MFSSNYLLLSLLGLVAASPTTPQCKEVPSSKGWPSKQTWSKLNSTLGGKLLKPLPPAIVCDNSSSLYSASECAIVGKQFKNSEFLDQDPISLHYPNWQEDACLPSALYNGTCDVEPFPKYTVNASEASDVMHAVKFAHKHNIRLSIKNTGHDYLGRSTSPEFSLWTHNLKGFQVINDFKGTNCSSTTYHKAAKIGAGMQFAETYNAANVSNVVVAGGSDGGVGLGGWLLGGGHSPVGSIVGLGVDNVLEMEVVSPTGELLTINACNNPDLFFAMRGGGGSTFGALVSATVKTYANNPVNYFKVQFASTLNEATSNNNTNFYKLLGDLYYNLPSWSDAYINGVFFFEASNGGSPFGKRSLAYKHSDSSESDSAAATPSKAVPLSFFFTGYQYKGTVDELKTIVSNFTNKINMTSGITGAGLVNVTTLPHITDTFPTKLEPEAAGQNLALSSRLLPKESLMNTDAIVKFFEATAGGSTEGLLVSGPALRDFNDTESVSVTPAWRSTYLHQITGVSWAYRNATAEAEYQAINLELAKALASLAPESGCYQNEANIHEPSLTEAFWGEDNYNRLLKIKQKYDPKGTFWCIPCIGNEAWTMNNATGQLCRASSTSGNVTMRSRF